ncbi:MAG: SapC family protein [Desulfobacterales bacterium]|nr:SapC family protein [Desulfobacterales bacterium]
MFTKLEPLENSKHQDLRLSKNQNFEFAKNVSSVPLSFSEIQAASQYYPVIFPSKENCIPTALLSLKEKENKFINDQYKWIVPYIPLQIRLYPFALVKLNDTEDKFALCIDRDAPHFKAGQGDPLFTADGEPNESVQAFFKTLETYQQELNATRALFTDLLEKELILPKKIDFKINGEPKSIDGFNAVDMEKVVALDDEMLAGLVRNGAMQGIFNHLQSLSKIATLAQMSSMA